MGDFRVAQLEGKENFYVCPPLGYVEQSLRRLDEAKVAATVVVPNWVGKPWHLWLRERAVHVEVLEWSAFPAIWWDVSEKKKKPHVFGAAMGVCGVCGGFQGNQQVRVEGGGTSGKVEG